MNETVATLYIAELKKKVFVHARIVTRVLVLPVNSYFISFIVSKIFYGFKKYSNTHRGRKIKRRYEIKIRNFSHLPCVRIKTER